LNNCQTWLTVVREVEEAGIPEERVLPKCSEHVHNAVGGLVYKGAHAFFPKVPRPITQHDHVTGRQGLPAEWLDSEREAKGAETQRQGWCTAGGGEGGLAPGDIDKHSVS
jgi:hypothetical protein